MVFWSRRGTPAEEASKAAHRRYAAYQSSSSTPHSTSSSTPNTPHHYRTPTDDQLPPTLPPRHRSPSTTPPPILPPRPHRRSSSSRPDPRTENYSVPSRLDTRSGSRGSSCPTSPLNRDYEKGRREKKARGGDGEAVSSPGMLSPNYQSGGRQSKQHFSTNGSTGRSLGVTRSLSHTHRRSERPVVSERGADTRQRANSHGAVRISGQVMPPALPPRHQQHQQPPQQQASFRASKTPINSQRSPNLAPPSSSAQNTSSNINLSKARNQHRSIDIAALNYQSEINSAPLANPLEYSSGSDSDFHPALKHWQLRPPQTHTHRNPGHTCPRSASTSRNPFSLFSSAGPSRPAAPLLSLETAETIQRPLRKAGAAVAAVASAARNSIRQDEEAVGSDEDSDWGTGRGRRQGSRRRRRSSLVESFQQAFLAARERRRSVEPVQRSAPVMGQMAKSPEVEKERRKEERNRLGTQPAGWLGGEAQVTKRCLTCGDMMRFGAGGVSFACKKCAMINDLEVVEMKVKVSKVAGDAPAGSKIKRKPVGGPIEKMLPLVPIDVAHTQGMIRTCLERYIAQQCNGPTGRCPVVPVIEPKYIFQPVATYITHSFNFKCLQASFTSLKTTSPEGTPISANIDWNNLGEWYHIVINAAETWNDVYDGFGDSISHDINPVQLEADLLLGQERLQKTLLKSAEQVLKRPGTPFHTAQDLRFVLLMLYSPLFQPGVKTFRGRLQDDSRDIQNNRFTTGPDKDGSIKPLEGYHSSVIKRIIGLLVNASDAQAKQVLIQWFSHLDAYRFSEIKEVAAGLLIYRLRRTVSRAFRRPEPPPPTTFDDMLGSTVPAMSGTSAFENMAATMNIIRRPDNGFPMRHSAVPTATPPSVTRDDWQVKASCELLAMLWSANSGTKAKAAAERVTGRKKSIKVRGQIVPTSDFYLSYLDLLDIQTEFMNLKKSPNTFNICNYPFLFGIELKKTLMKFESETTQHQTRLAGAIEDALLVRETNMDFMLNIDRKDILGSSLREMHKGPLLHPGLLKRKLKIQFQGEEGQDYGGLSREWFIKLSDEIFSKRHDMFVYDERSNLAYFNPKSKKFDEFRMLGIVVALAIYNSCILGLPVPQFLFRKLLGSAASDQLASTLTWPKWQATLDDLEELNPVLAHGLKATLEYEGDDFDDVFGDTTFSINVQEGRRIRSIPLCPHGESRVLKRSNRHEYVDAYIRWTLDYSVRSAFEAFQTGFFGVFQDGSLALSFCRPEELELLILGSPEPIDVSTLKAVAEYAGWREDRLPDPGEAPPPPASPDTEPVIEWFWDSLERASVEDQKKLLAFVTGSDRVPAGGATALRLKIVCQGSDEDRLPTGRTCFNTLSLPRYRKRETLERKLWQAVRGSEGFGFS